MLLVAATAIDVTPFCGHLDLCNSFMIVLTPTLCGVRSARGGWQLGGRAASLASSRTTVTGTARSPFTNWAVSRSRQRLYTLETPAMASGRVSESLADAMERVSARKTTLALVAGTVGAVAGGALIYRRLRSSPAVPTSGPFPVATLPADAYDAVIVGAGPSGSVCGYYIAKGGGKVALLDKASFPRGAGMRRQRSNRRRLVVTRYKLLCRPSGSARKPHLC